MRHASRFYRVQRGGIDIAYAGGKDAVMTFYHGDFVTVYDRNGNVECRGKIVGITMSNPQYYDIAPCQEFSMARRMCSIPASRVRKAYSQPVLAEPMHVLDHL